MASCASAGTTVPSVTVVKPEPLSLPIADAYNVSYKESNTAIKPEPIDTSEAPAMDPVTLVKCKIEESEDELNAMGLDSDSDPEPEAANRQRQNEEWEVTPARHEPTTLIYRTGDVDDISPRYSPTHPDYDNAAYYEYLTALEGKQWHDSPILRTHTDNPDNCRQCQNTRKCPRCTRVQNPHWATKEHHRLRARARMTTNMLALVEEHIRFLRNDGGRTAAYSFIDRVTRVATKHRELIASKYRTMYTANFVSGSDEEQPSTSSSPTDEDYKPTLSQRFARYDSVLENDE